ncbi:MAG: SIS domain-containing protein [Candidatus Kariarchaeaceae archaeon]
MDDIDNKSQLINLEKVFWQSYSETTNFQIPKKNLIVCGMGGSAIAGEYLSILSSHSKTTKQIIVWRDYTIPSFLNEDWIALIVSYSGNTEESISMLSKLLDENIETLIMSSGGMLQSLVGDYNLRYIQLKPGFQPRFAFPMILGKIYRLFEENLDLQKLSKKIEDQINKFGDIQVDQTIIDISHQLSRKNAIIISDQLNAPLSLRFRCQLNENTKLIAQNYVLPEFNHNGIVGFENVNPDEYVVVIISSLEFEHPRTKIHREYVKSYLGDKGIVVFELNSNWDNLLLHILDITKKVDYLSYITAEKLGVDPIPVKSINKLKLKLKEN